jgi:hypothetical protein
MYRVFSLLKGNPMNAANVRDVLHREPFEPFEIVMSSGEKHLVKHPELVLVTEGRIIVVVDPVADRTADLALMHVTELRRTQPQPSAESN